MRIAYPYNEILPKKTAHDVFIFNECAALAKEGNQVTLLCGKDANSTMSLFDHYHVPQDLFPIQYLPIVRKNNPFNLSWNFPFLFFSQQAIRKMKPDWVFLSVRKQGSYHLSRKIPGIHYLYEVHELAYYPFMHALPSDFAKEKLMLEKADLITVTTDALKEILLKPPYALDTPIEVVPLAVKASLLPPPPKSKGEFHMMYVGQLYEGQGIPALFRAMRQVKENIKLTIVGGNENQIAELKQLSESLGIHSSIHFSGFIPPGKLPEIVQSAHAFIAPFENRGRMPYVAHTKLYEYAQWGRPIIAPGLPCVKEHFNKGGVILYQPDDEAALASAIQNLFHLHEGLQLEIESYAHQFSWENRAKKYTRLISNR